MAISLLPGISYGKSCISDRYKNKLWLKEFKLIMVDTSRRLNDIKVLAGATVRTGVGNGLVNIRVTKKRRATTGVSTAYSS